MRQKTLLTKLMLLVALVLMGAGTAWGATYTTVATFKSADVVTNSGYMEYSNDDWSLSVGGNNVSVGFNKTASNAKTIDNALGTTADPDNYGSVIKSLKKLDNVSQITFTYNGGSGNTGNIYLAYSTDNITWNAITLTSGTQGSSATTDMTFQFAEIESAYYGIILEKGSTTGVFRWDYVVATFDKVSSGSSLTASDLAITNATKDLSFDLYNTTTPQVINYTTSGTGAITITPASPTSYFSYVHDASAKTITVTPLSVTPSAQTITISQEADGTYDAGSVTFTVSVEDNTPYQGEDFVRINSLSNLTDGAKVILAARFNTTATDYYAMSATTSGKPTGVKFSSTTSSNGETVPVSILNNLDTYYWTVGVTSNGYTFTNANGKMLGYSSGTDFVTGGSNTEWVIAIGTADSNAMVGEYEGFSITNKNTSARGIALNNFYNFGAYAVSNYTNASYNFYLDIFVEGVTVTPSTTTSITADNVDIAYDATSGNIAYTVTNEVAGGELTAAIVSGGTIANLALGTIADNKVPFTCDANDDQSARTATVTLTYTYGSETVTKDVTITQAAAPAPAVVYTTIPELFAAATSAGSTATDIQVTFDSWVVSAVKSSNAYLTDNQGHGLIIYASSHGFQVNDVLTGTASCKVQLYRGSAELTNLTNSTDGLTVTSNGTVNAQNIAINELGGVNTGALLSYEGLTYNGSALVDDNNNTITPYNTLYTGTFENGKTYNVKGIYLQYNTTKEILPRSADDIEEVAAPATPSITVDPTTVNATADKTTGTINVTYNNVYPNVGVDAEWYTDATCATTTGAPSWIEIGFDTENNVEYTIAENTGEARTAYMKIWSYSGPEVKEYSEVITFTQAAPIAPATLPFSWDGGTSADFLALDGVTANGLGSDYAASNAPYRIKLDGDGDYIQVKTDGQIYKVTLEVKMLGGSNTSTITVQGSADGKTFTDVQELQIMGSQNKVLYLETTNSFDADYRYVRMLFTKGSNVGVGAVTINYVRKAITDAGYATYCLNNALDYTNVQGLKAYKATVANKQVSFTEVTEVPAGAGVLLKGDEGTYKIPVIASADPIENAFVGVTEVTYVNDPGIFVLMNGTSGVGFYRTNTSFTLSANTAYLPADVAAGRSFIGFDGETTGVNAVNGEGFMVNGPVYDLQGRRVAQPQKGLYIVNGRKVVIK